MRVVVVDDDPDILNFLRIFLVSMDAEAITYDRPDGAAALIRDERPDLVILDLQMPGDPQAGLHILAELRNDPTTARIPVILGSADGRKLRQLVAGMTLPRVHIVEKPFDMDVLEEAAARS